MSDGAWNEPDKPQHECGVVGIYAPDREVSRLLFFALFALQHRGQEAAGMAVSDGESVRMHKNMGLVSQVFDESVLEKLPGFMGIGHTRYSTTGSSTRINAQPIACTSVVGDIAVAHNGNLINSVELREELKAEGMVFEGTNDSEIIARLIAKYAHLDALDAVKEVMSRIKGAYSVIVLSQKKLFAFRDPLGLRPLALGRLNDGYVVVSESCALAPVGATLIDEVKPGEAIAISEAKGFERAQVIKPERDAMCLFEFIYFARPDSVMEGSSIYQTRVNMGTYLAQEHPIAGDAVVPVPDSGVPAAIGYAQQSGIPFVEGLIKSRYIHRTFIQPDPALRHLGVRLKLSPLVDQVKGKRLILVDDSIVRSTTMSQIVKMLKDVGAAEVHVRITAPPIMHPCYFGIDMPERSQLAAANLSIERIRTEIGADSLGYLSVENATKATGQPMNRFCLACFNGKYPMEVPDEMDKMALEPVQVGDLSAVSSGQLKLMED